MDFKDIGIGGHLKSGKNYFTCPKCSAARAKGSKLKCLTVNVEPENNWWNCNHCGWSGNLERFEKDSAIREYSKAPFTGVKQFKQPTLELFQKKGISTEIAIALGWYDLVDKDNHVFLAIPMKGRYGQLYNVKFRNLTNPEGVKFTQVPKDKGSESVVMGLHDLEMDDDTGTYGEILICEGESDLATWKRIHKNSVSVPMGAPNPKSKNFDEEFSYLSHPATIDVFSKAEGFLIAVDNDEAGKLLENQLLERLGKSRCKIVTYSGGRKDINEVYLAEGLDGVRASLSSAAHPSYEGIVTVAQLEAEINNIALNGIPGGKKIGFKLVDNYYTYKKPYLYVVTGIPGSGKSTYVRWTLIEYLRNNPEERIGFYSPEQRPYGREVIKMMEVYNKKPISVQTEGEKREAMDFLNKHMCFIVPNKNSHKDFNKIKSPGDINTITSILDYTEALKRTMNLSGVVIDAWNKLEHEIPRGDNEHNYTGKVLDAIINFNEASGIFSIIIAHPTKTQQKPSGNYQRPSLYSISGSAHWYNKADVGLIVHRDKYSEKEGGGFYYDEGLPSVVYVDKMKFEELGREGYFELSFDKGSNTYSDYNAAPQKAQPIEMVQTSATAIPVAHPSFSDDDDDYPF